jgi:hypothetical protein
MKILPVLVKYSRQKKITEPPFPPEIPNPQRIRTRKIKPNYLFDKLQYVNKTLFYFGVAGLGWLEKFKNLSLKGEM